MGLLKNIDLFCSFWYVFISVKALSSGGEHFLDAEGVGGSIPPVPTIFPTQIFICDGIFVFIKFLSLVGTK